MQTPVEMGSCKNMAAKTHLCENHVFTEGETRGLPGGPNSLLMHRQTFHPRRSTTPYFKSLLRLFLFFSQTEHDFVGPTAHRDCVATKNT